MEKFCINFCDTGTEITSCESIHILNVGRSHHLVCLHGTVSANYRLELRAVQCRYFIMLCPRDLDFWRTRFGRQGSFLPRRMSAK